LFGELAELWVSRPISLDPPTLSLFRPMLSLFRPMLSLGRPAPFSVERVVVQRLNLVFGKRKSAQKQSATTGQKLFSYQRWIRFVLVDEENGRLVYVKRNLMLLCLWGRRNCRSNYNRFDVAMPKSLEIGKNSQHRHTNNANQHQHSSGFRNAGRFGFFSHRFW
jgi:hypothetical protein